MRIRAINVPLGLALSAALVGAACVDSEGDTNDPGPIEPDKPQPDDPNPTIPGNDEMTPDIFSANLCEVSADTTGACSLACDAELLIEQYVPEGTCMIFECLLADGTTRRAGGCNT